MPIQDSMINLNKSFRSSYRSVLEPILITVKSIRLWIYGTSCPSTSRTYKSRLPLLRVPSRTSCSHQRSSSTKRRIVPSLYSFRRFNEYCNLNNLGKPRFTYDFYAGPFGQREISVKRDELKYDDGDGMKHLDTQEFIFGIDITKEKTGIHLGNDH